MGSVSQLEHIIQTWHNGNHRQTALQAGLFDPLTDYTNQPVRGFPCLQQVSLARCGQSGLSIIGFYATQYVVERAYGNYLGLCRLGRFMAQEMDLSFSQMVCVATPVQLARLKKSVRELANRVGQIIEDISGESLDG